MAEFVAHLPTLSVTNPIWLWLFNHGWEDPGWGRMPINQVALGLALHEIGTRLANRELQGQVQAIAQKVVAENAQHAVK